MLYPPCTGEGYFAKLLPNPSGFKLQLCRVKNIVHTNAVTMSSMSNMLLIKFIIFSTSRVENREF